MAFLCPSRRGRQKKKHKESKAPFLGRITGSASIDTLVRVGLEKQHGLAPESRMRVTQDFLATRKDELGAQKGDTLYKLYEDGDWVYVLTETGQEGFIPTICVTPLNDNKTTPSSKSKRHGHSTVTENGSTSGSHLSSPSQNGKTDSTKQTVPNHFSRRRSTGSHDVSTQAETGSDVSSSSLSQSVISPDTVNPIPKPVRTHNIPDIVSTTKGSSQKTSTDSHHSDVSAFKRSLVVKENGVNVINSGNGHRDKSLRHSRNSITDKTGSDNVDGSKATLSTNLTTAGLRLSHASGGDSITEVRTFVKRIGQKFVVVFSFDATDENDVTVERGEVVTVLNDRDPHWTWVKKRNGKEGFAPRPYMCSIPENLLPNSGTSTGKSETRPKTVTSQPAQYHDVRELYTLRQFTAQSADDISVEAGEQVFADLANQIELDWLWVYATATQCYGYIPKDNVSASPRFSSASKIKGSYHKQPSYL